MVFDSSKEKLLDNIQRICGSILAVLGIFVVIATFRTTKNSWVIVVVTLLILSNIAEVAQASENYFEIPE